MRSRIYAVPFAMVACLVGVTTPSAAQCEPDGDTQFVCGPISPEDLARIPDTPWVIVASWEPDGYLSSADSRDYTTTRLFPTESPSARQDRTAYGSCPGISTEGFQAHGISLRPGESGLHTLYVVRHGPRESVEVFEVDARATEPSLTWIGCAVAPDELGLNAVVALPDNAFAATSPRTGDIWEWHPESGWARVPGSEDIGPNGLEISPDAQWYYVAGYASQSVIRLSRGQSPPQKTTVATVNFNIDNIHWAPDGSLLAAGHSAPTPTRVGECIRDGICDGIVSRVSRVDPEAMTSEEIFTYPSNDSLILGTVAIEVGDELWVGGVAGGTRIARVPLQ